MPIAFFRAVEATVWETLQQGLYGWEVTDCLVTMTHSGYLGRHGHAHQRFNKSMSSTGEDFRKLTPLVVIGALEQARTIVCEPIHRFHLELPAETLGSVLPVLAQARAVAPTRAMQGSWCTLEGDIAAANVHQLRQRLPALTRGEGAMESAFDRYEPITGPVPTRPRWDDNPVNRKEYLLRVAGRRSRAPAGS
jgi:ribosomal protection tetracycline resistance protein